MRRHTRTYGNNRTHVLCPIEQLVAQAIDYIETCTHHNHQPILTVSTRDESLQSSTLELVRMTMPGLSLPWHDLLPAEGFPYAFDPGLNNFGGFTSLQAFFPVASPPKPLSSPDAFNFYGLLRLKKLVATNSPWCVLH